MTKPHLTLDDIAPDLKFLSDARRLDPATLMPVEAPANWVRPRCSRCRVGLESISNYSSPRYKWGHRSSRGDFSGNRRSASLLLEHLLAWALRMPRDFIDVREVVAPHAAAASHHAKIDWEAGRSYASVLRTLTQSPIAPYVHFSLRRQPSSDECHHATKQLALYFGVEAEAIQRAADSFAEPDCRDAVVRTWSKWILRMVNIGLPPKAVTLSEVETLLESEHAIFREMGMSALAKVDLSSAVPCPDLIASAPGPSGTC